MPSFTRHKLLKSLLIVVFSTTASHVVTASSHTAVSPESCATSHKDTSTAVTATNEDIRMATQLLSSMHAKYKEAQRTHTDTAALRRQTLLMIARELTGRPYVAHTLEVNDNERLVVNLRQLDCTTYVETVMALYLCIKDGKTTFDDYTSTLRDIRYRQGHVSYADRLHYFTSWIDDNTDMGLVTEISSQSPPFTATQTLHIDFMTTHTASYRMLHGNRQLINAITATERSLSGRKCRYIPKGNILNSSLLRNTIHDGDIIVIVTNKRGLDTSHIGFAVWHDDGLHLLNASQIHKRVVEEPMTLHDYMQRHPSQTGIRVVRIR